MIYIYIYICVCVCVCVFFILLNWSIDMKNLYDMYIYIYTLCSLQAENVCLSFFPYAL